MCSVTLFWTWLRNCYKAGLLKYLVVLLHPRVSHAAEIHWTPSITYENNLSKKTNNSAQYALFNNKFQVRNGKWNNKKFRKEKVCGSHQTFWCVVSLSILGAVPYYEEPAKRVKNETASIQLFVSYAFFRIKWKKWSK